MVEKPDYRRLCFPDAPPRCAGKQASVPGSLLFVIHQRRLGAELVLLRCRLLRLGLGLDNTPCQFGVAEGKRNAGGMLDGYQSRALLSNQFLISTWR
jgi:hypothetical protein